MKLTVVARCALLATLTSIVACGSDSTTGVPSTPARIRIVNSVFQYTDATSSASKVAPRAIDVLIDSAGTPPGALAIPPISLQSPSGADASLYEPISAIVHSFVARLAGDTGPTSTFYTNANSLPYLPLQFLTAGTPYTLVVAGLVPVTPAAGAPHILTAPTAAPFTALTDDPFPPPLVNGVYQTRFRLVNAAPFAAATGLGATLSLYLTPGATPPTSVAGLTALGVAAYRFSSAYFNADGGAYTVTVATGTRILAQSVVTFAPGEVRTFVVQSTAYAATPSTSNHVLQALIDNKY